MLNIQHGGTLHGGAHVGIEKICIHINCVCTLVFDTFPMILPTQILAAFHCLPQPQLWIALWRVEFKPATPKWPQLQWNRFVDVRVMP